eukprot:CAMPEP_0177544100 /NCGR_PEP_ID=MMETSP0369-20130122/61794_1 /TAXON_ID=447022 ORGANISM="Scrippsiella hangoei-like, Strain SHHI-4" /NCGR_SAMPLE_ID=MMETSP0369 /ASSEMBLY_ACC=CAM_ASM_000364 /LENGTH=46 /DNA_ID= /DNA_START= /DNA_END= /DNA_ORIENTATION=
MARVEPLPAPWQPIWSRTFVDDRGELAVRRGSSGSDDLHLSRGVKV